MFENVSRTAVIYRFLGTHLTRREERVFFIYQNRISSSFPFSILHISLLISLSIPHSI